MSDLTPSSRHALGTGRRRTARRARAALAGGVAALVLTPVWQAFASSFTTVSSPFVAANDFITGLPNCQIQGTESDIGIMQDGTHFYVGDICNGTMYRFPATGGAAPGDVQVSLQNNLDGGMAVGNGVYYGVNLSGSTALVEQFDPNTLVPGQVVMRDNTYLRDLAFDPQTGDLYATGDNGIWRIQNPSTATPTVTRVVAATSGDAFDGLAITPDDTTLWVAAHGDGKLFAYTIGSYALANTLTPRCSGPDGMAIAPPGTLVGGMDLSDNVFVNCNDGSIHMLTPQGWDSTVATGGSRGDFAFVGTDGYMYATQGDRVEQLVPGFFGLKYGARAVGLSVAQPSGSITKSDTGLYSNPSGGSTEIYAAATTVPGTAGAWALRSDAQTWSTGEARAEAAVAEVDIDTGTSPDHLIQAKALDAVADTVCSGSLQATATIGELIVDGSPIELPPMQPQNLVIPIGSLGLTLTVNEVRVTGGAGAIQHSKTTVLHLSGPNLDVKVATAEAIAAPC